MEWIDDINSVLSGQRDNDGRATVDVRAELERLLMLQEGLVAVKASIQRANAAIYEDVLRLWEKKALVQMLDGLNTKHGSEPGQTLQSSSLRTIAQRSWEAVTKSFLSGDPHIRIQELLAFQGRGFFAFGSPSTRPSGRSGRTGRG
jgi:hypothetical protein